MHIAHLVPATKRVGDATRHRPLGPFGVRVSQVVTALLVFMFGIFLLAVTGFVAYGFAYADRVYEGTRIAGVDVGGMTRDEVATVVESRYAAFPETEVVLTAGNKRFERTASELGVSIDVEATVAQVMAFGRFGTPWDRSLEWSEGAIRGVELRPVLDVDASIFHDALLDLAPGVVFPPSNARVDVEPGGEVYVVRDIPGLSINVTASAEHVVDELVDPEKATVSLALVSVPAEVTVADIESGVPNVQRALAGTLFIESPDGRWGLTRSALSQLVWVDDDGTMQVRREGVEAYVAGIAEQVDHPSENASISIDENGAFVVVPHVESAIVDQAVTVDRLVEAIQAGETSVELVVERTDPAILNEHAEAWAAEADTLVGDGITLTWSGGTSQLGRADLIAALVITPQPDDDEKFALTFDSAVLAERLTPLQEDLHIDAREAQFRLVDGSIRFQAEARQGREMDMDASVDAVLEAVSRGDPEAPISVNVIEPTYTSASRSEISLPDVLGESLTYYGNSSEPRRNNVERAVELEDGWLIAPGETFSFAEFSGLITEENGFVTGFGIVAEPGGGVTTAPVIGGGICQVSTTIFQAAFWAGVKIVERWAHPYWIESYGQEPYGMRGLDAMVNIEPDWALDFKFENTTGNWIAVVMAADGQNVYAEIRGTNPGWEIDVPEPAITNVVKPDNEMMYTDSPELPKGQELQVERAKDGFTSTITRTVRDEDGEVIDEYSYESTYSASRNLTLRGTGGED
jgi:vancomycin resistance protein YoaR